ncbi:GspH/FimT family pseudopilin [Pseudomonas sp. BJa5]|uniref:GspH/FimT family pseudopilin n=1 Tax=Pseudomonas sp. BJa5 TaxID=2936270 RepID=UPI00255A0911|nr:GspH/FimT family pseudopilin [Pseudomonas sp. BGr12]MDL2423220.1 GspH/FimT family pseudopilin [Pseudomonas sp. BGr12]
MKQQGVTLIQILFATALLGVLVQLGIPAYSTMTEGLHRQAAARDLAQALRTARSEALLRNTGVRLQALDGDWSNGWRMTLEQDTPQLLHEWRREKRAAIVGNQPVARQVRFNGLGVPLLEGGGFQAGTLHVCQRPEALSHYQVVLSASGRISLREDLMTHPLCAAAPSAH